MAWLSGVDGDNGWKPGNWSHLTWPCPRGDNLFTPTLHFWDKGYKNPVPLLQDGNKQTNKKNLFSVFDTPEVSM